MTLDQICKLFLLASFLYAFEQPVALAQTNSEIDSLISNIESANNTSSSINSGCMQKSLRPKPNPLRVQSPQEVPTATQDSNVPDKKELVVGEKEILDINGNSIKVSIIDEDQIKNLVRLYPKKLRIYDEKNCAARAHTIGDKLAQNGIETAKILLQPESSWVFSNYIIPDEKAKGTGNRTPQWDFHIANIIYVKKTSGEIVEYVIDPFMESMPVPKDKWLARLRTNPKSSIGSIDVVSRFVLDTNDMNQNKSEYDQERLDRSYQIMNNSGGN